MFLRKRKQISQMVKRLFYQRFSFSNNTPSVKKVLHIPSLLPHYIGCHLKKNSKQTPFVSHKKCVHSSDIHLFHYQRLYMENTLKGKKIRRWKVNSYLFFLHKSGKYALNKKPLFRPLFKRVRFYQENENIPSLPPEDVLRHPPL